MFGLLRGLIRVITLFIVPYSCWLHRMCCACADCGLLYRIYLMLLIAYLQAAAGLAHIRQIAGIAC